MEINLKELRDAIELTNASLPIWAGLIAALWAVVQHIQKTRSEQKKTTFDTYHNLVNWLMENGTGQAPYIDRQIATVFELERYPHYYTTTVKVLARLKKRCEGDYGKYRHLIAQIDESMERMYLRAESACLSRAYGSPMLTAKQMRKMFEDTYSTYIREKKTS